MISTTGSIILTSKLYPVAKPLAKNITSESAIDIHHLSSASFKTTGSLTKLPELSIIGQ